MNLSPSDAAVVRELLADPSVTVTSVFARMELADRLDEEAPPLGAHVFRLVCKLGTDARKEEGAVNKMRKQLREQMGKKALPKGAGPAKVTVLCGPTMNEYNALEPWQKEKLRAAFDDEIEQRKRDWPEWSCGMTTRTVAKAPSKSPVVPKKGKKAKSVLDTKEVREGGRRRIVVVTRYSSARPDELSCDAHLGAKIPIDRLVQAGVLRGDTLGWLARYGEWKQVPPGEGYIVVDVHEVGAC